MPDPTLTYQLTYAPPPASQQKIPIDGFVGLFTVPTLETFLQEELSGIESLGEINQVVRGIKTVDELAQVLADSAKVYITLYSKSPEAFDAAGTQALVDKYTNMFRVWCGKQPRASYLIGATGPVGPPVPEPPPAPAAPVAPVYVRVIGEHFIVAGPDGYNVVDGQEVQQDGHTYRARVTIGLMGKQILFDQVD